MEVYPSPYIEHNLPLVLLSGLGEQQDETRTKVSSARQESGTKVTSSSPECHGDRAGALLQQFFRLDGSDLAWNSQALLAPPDSLKYSMKAIGRVGMAIAKDHVRRIYAYNATRAIHFRHGKLLRHPNRLRLKASRVYRPRLSCTRRCHLYHQDRQYSQMASLLLSGSPSTSNRSHVSLFHSSTSLRTTVLKMSRSRPISIPSVVHCHAPASRHVSPLCS